MNLEKKGILGCRFRLFRLRKGNDYERTFKKVS